MNIEITILQKLMNGLSVFLLLLLWLCTLNVSMCLKKILISCFVGSFFSVSSVMDPPVRKRGRPRKEEQHKRGRPKSHVGKYSFLIKLERLIDIYSKKLNVSKFYVIIFKAYNPFKITLFISSYL